MIPGESRCRDGQHLSDGSRLADTVRDIGEVEQVVAVGVNCTAPTKSGRYLWFCRQWIVRPNKEQ